MSVNPNQTNITPNDSLFLPATTVIPTIYSGTTLISTATNFVTIGIQGLTSTNTVVASYIHPAGGGAGQFFNAITPGTNQVFFNMGQNTSNGESISWIAKA
jgi:hypothetical protein